jgi:hypothetical protein
MLFSLRNPSVAITTYVIQLIAYHHKEHVIIVAMSNVSIICASMSLPFSVTDPPFLGCLRRWCALCDRRLACPAPLL